MIRGDKQHEGLHAGESTQDTDGYSPVVEWGTIRRLLTLSVQHKLRTTQVDFNNAFVQAKLSRPMYLDLPPGIKDTVGYEGLIMELHRSLYGHKFAAKLFYELVRKSLTSTACGFTVSPHDHCLFLRHDCLMISWIDDVILIHKDPDVADNIILQLRSMGLQLDKECDDGGLEAYLGVDIAPQADGSLILRQTGLINRILEALDITNANPKATPSLGPLGRSLDHDAFDGRYNYRSVIGMILFLVNTTRADCAFAAHQCARFSHDPREPHAVALKRLGAYLLKTREDGLHVSPILSSCWSLEPGRRSRSYKCPLSYWFCHLPG